MTQEVAISELDDLHQDWLDGAGLSKCGVEDLIKKIYNEFGKCKECKYCRINGDTEKSYWCTNEDLPTNEESVSPNFYCADFKRKEIK